MLANFQPDSQWPAASPSVRPEPVAAEPDAGEYEPLPAPVTLRDGRRSIFLALELRRTAA